MLHQIHLLVFKENLNVKVINSVSFENGRAFLLNIELHGKNMSIISVYAPNKERDRILFFKN